MKPLIAVFCMFMSSLSYSQEMLRETLQLLSEDLMNESLAESFDKTINRYSISQLQELPKEGIKALQRQLHVSLESNSFKLHQRMSQAVFDLAAYEQNSLLRRSGKAPLIKTDSKMNELLDRLYQSFKAKGTKLDKDELLSEISRQFRSSLEEFSKDYAQTDEAIAAFLRQKNWVKAHLQSKSWFMNHGMMKQMATQYQGWRTPLEQLDYNQLVPGAEVYADGVVDMADETAKIAQEGIARQFQTYYLDRSLVRVISDKDVKDVSSILIKLSKGGTQVTHLTDGERHALNTIIKLNDEALDLLVSARGPIKAAYTRIAFLQMLDEQHSTRRSVQRFASQFTQVIDFQYQKMFAALGYNDLKIAPLLTEVVGEASLAASLRQAHKGVADGASVYLTKLTQNLNSKQARNILFKLLTR